MHWVRARSALKSWFAIAPLTASRKMLHVSVRCVENEPKLTLTLTIAGSTRHLQRPKEESLEKTLKRLSLTASKGSQRGKGVNSAPKATPVVKLLERENGREVLGELPNERAWLDGAELLLGEDKYQVILNPPVANKLSVLGHVMTGCPVVPQVSVN